MRAMEMTGQSLPDDFAKEYVSLAEAWGAFVKAKFPELLNPLRFCPDHPSSSYDLVFDPVEEAWVPPPRIGLEYDADSINWYFPNFAARVFAEQVALECGAFEFDAEGDLNSCELKIWKHESQPKFWETYVKSEIGRNDGGARS
jgi:hypothetical protein